MLRGQIKKGIAASRMEFERLLASIEHQDRFKLAGLEKKLEAHQEAYALALK